MDATTKNVSANLADMKANPEKYGFTWGWGHLHHKGLRVTMGRGAPYIEHRDLNLLRQTFGDDYVLRSMNEQSARVRDQTIRTELWESVPLRSDEDAMQTIVLEKALGLKSRTRKVTVVEKIVEKRIYVAEDGMEFEDKAEFLAHQADLKIEATE